MPTGSAAPPSRIELDLLDPLPHVRRAAQTASLLSDGDPVDARAALLAAVLVGRQVRSDAFTEIGRLLAKVPVPDVELPSGSGTVKGGISLQVSDALGRAFDRARPFLERKPFWGRDWVAVALSATDDPSLERISREAGSTPADLRMSWFDFLHPDDLRDPGDEGPPATSDSDVRPGTREAGAAYLLTWNPSRFPFDELESLTDRIRTEGSVTYPWSTGNRRDMALGARVFLMRQAEEPRGIVGSGTVVGAVEERPYRDPGRKASAKGQATRHMVDVKWHVLAREPLVELPELVRVTGEEKLWNGPASGVAIPKDVHGSLEEAWRAATALPSIQSLGPDTRPYLRRLRPDALEALASAWGLASETGRGELEIQHLLAGLLQAGGGVLDEVLEAVSLDREDVLAGLAPPAGTPLPPSWPSQPLAELPPLSTHARQALRMAERRAQALRDGRIDTRDLVNGALSIQDCSVVQRLRQKGLSLSDIRWRWEPPVMLAGYWSDSTSGTDLLDMTRDARVLATIMASGQVQPPLSIGLFGAWGSGKSFFMKLLRKEILRAQRSGAPDVCRRIVHIRFNAWHYIDSNLWASLANEVFERLGREIEAQAAADEERDLSDEDRKARRKVRAAQLLMATRRSRNELEEAIRRKERAEEELQGTEAELSQLQQDLWSLRGPIPPERMAEETLRQLLAGEDGRKKLDEAMAALGIDTRDVTPEDLERRLERWRGRQGWLLAWWHALTGRDQGKAGTRPERHLDRRFIVMALAAVAVAVLLADPAEWFDGILAWLNEVGAALVLVAGAVAPWLKRMKEIRADVQPVVEKLDAARNRARKSLEKESEDRRKLQENRLARARAQEKTKREELSEVERALESLLSSDHIGEFVMERRESEDYRQHLGVIARARQDFEQLSELLRRPLTGQELLDELLSEAEEQERKRLERYRSAVPPIDRIVLYIDDLDRCPEEKVVDVLQAVHLLLAFELFVVVVGVDPRWLLHSLADRSDVFSEPGGGGDGSRLEPRYWRSTPMDYLEKIFQIPFHLRPMGEQGYGDLVAALTRDEPTVGPQSGTGGLGTGATDDERTGEGGGQGGPGRDANALRRNDGKSGQGGLGGDPRDGEPKGRQEEDGGGGNATDGAEEAGGSAGAGDGEGENGGNQGQVRTGSEHASNSAGDADETARPTPRLTIEGWERTFMQALHPFIDSPRSAKRFVNVYRLVRASHVEPRVGSPRRDSQPDVVNAHQQVLFLLGMLTGYPASSLALFSELQRTAATSVQSWETFRTGLSPDAPPGEPDLPEGRSAGSRDGPDAREWGEFVRVLERVHDELEERHLAFDPPVSELRTWVPAVSRYSFRSGAHTRMDAE